MNLVFGRPVRSGRNVLTVFPRGILRKVKLVLVKPWFLD